jgi:hypothetical protein
MRRFVLPALAVALTAALVSMPVAAQADTKTSTGCNPSKYKSHTKILTASKGPAITHLSTYSIAPGYHRTTKRTASEQLVLSASVTYKSGAHVEVGLPGKILGQAGAKVDLSLAASGKRTTSKSVTVTTYISNTTKKNAQFVFFRGQTKASGTFRKYFCRIYYLSGQNYGPAYVTYRDGKWKSYAIPGNGALRCGAGTSNLGSLSKLALKIGCRA